MLDSRISKGCSAMMINHTQENSIATQKIGSGVNIKRSLLLLNGIGLAGVPPSHAIFALASFNNNSELSYSTSILQLLPATLSFISPFKTYDRPHYRYHQHCVWIDGRHSLLCLAGPQYCQPLNLASAIGLFLLLC